MKEQPKDIKTLADLTPDGENFNRHTEFGQKLLEDSLRKFGAGRSILVDQSCAISSLDSQRDTKKAIYGKGYLVSEKAAAEKAAATRWTLSDRERAIIAKLSKNDNNGND